MHTLYYVHTGHWLPQVRVHPMVEVTCVEALFPEPLRTLSVHTLLHIAAAYRHGGWPYEL